MILHEIDALRGCPLPPTRVPPVLSPDDDADASSSLDVQWGTGPAAASGNSTMVEATLIYLILLPNSGPRNTGSNGEME